MFNSLFAKFFYHPKFSMKRNLWKRNFISTKKKHLSLEIFFDFLVFGAGLRGFYATVRRSTPTKTYIRRSKTCGVLWMAPSAARVCAGTGPFSTKRFLKNVEPLTWVRLRSIHGLSRRRSGNSRARQAIRPTCPKRKISEAIEEPSTNIAPALTAVTKRRSPYRS